jgi:hypothetical protein
MGLTMVFILGAQVCTFSALSCHQLLNSDGGAWKWYHLCTFLDLCYKDSLGNKFRLSVIQEETVFVPTKIHKNG